MEKVLQAFQVQSTPGSTPEVIQEATKWLEGFQATAEAWQVADNLLSQPVGPGSPVTTPGARPRCAPPPIRRPVACLV